ncbi:hypothetical protein [Paenibacillus sacheonensis]|uniref:Uncharacterized protein n=1 Tax=Paenibacillus sacheonensis TaxID=742054 RepID=A0A7X4YUV1_9BACL|nr:hypothetical protein [Paenibacillus sacheonensis]MBM7568089.1 hypothetical protein [Paenibacillus sacheonensis]NBC72883.1 hypothetical protein [Paenibacillus sacheonensis]
MKRHDINSHLQDYKVGESYIFLMTEIATNNIIKKVGKISNTGVTTDSIPFVEVDFSGMKKKYAISVLSRTFYSGFREKMDKIPDPSILGEVMVVRKSLNNTGEVTKVNGLPGEVTKVKTNQAGGNGDVMKVN